MAEKTIAEKLQVKPGRKFLLVNPPREYRSVLGQLPAGAKLLQAPTEPAESIQVFIANRHELEEQLPQLKSALAPNGMIWVTYYKGTSKTKPDINRDSINSYAQSIGMQGVAMISIDQDWAALRIKLV